MLKKSELRFFKDAERAAHLSDYKSIHIGAVLVYQGKVIASGCNTNKTNPFQKKYNRRYRKFRSSTGRIIDSCHAELACIKSVPSSLAQNIDWKKCKLFVYRISPGSPLGYSIARPCPACMAFIKDMGIRHIYYTTQDGYAYERIVGGEK